MTPETEAFLDLVRHAEEPSSEDEQRVLRALQASIAAGVTTSVALKASGWESWLAKVASAFASTTAKLSLLAVGTTLGLSIEHGPTLRQSATSTPTAPPPAAIPWPAEVAPAAPPATAAAAALPSMSPTTPPAPPKRRSERVASLRDELNVLDRAQRALKAGDGEGALRELDASRTGDGSLRAERQAARILALCSAGRVAEARAGVARFFEEYPESAHRAAIASACANLQWIESR